MKSSLLAVLFATVCIVVANLPKATPSSFSYSGPGSPPGWHVSPGGSASFSYSGDGPIPPEIARFLPPGLINLIFGPPNNQNQPQPPPYQNYQPQPPPQQNQPQPPTNQNQPQPPPNQNQPQPPTNQNQPLPPPSRRQDPGRHRRCSMVARSDTWWQCVAARRPHALCCNFWTDVKKNCLPRLSDSDADQIEPRLARHCCNTNRH